MIKKSSFFSLVFLLIFMISVGLVSAATLNLWDLFPKSKQGENGIYLKAYDSQNNIFRNLDYIKDYVFGTPGQPWSIPY
ncbi:MAG: hypothetical protein N2513_10775, partial [Deltaproteobacteria bacterium]|nr:hypothetical protein [Deltaproteobacteria bacterium]